MKTNIIKVIHLPGSTNKIKTALGIGSSNIAKKFHIPEIIIGLTIVSIGTSMPELYYSLYSGYASSCIT